MNKKNLISNLDESDIFSSPFNEIKKDYLSKKENPYSLYTKYHKKYNISKDVFLSIINLLKVESNKPIKKPSKHKSKRKNNIYRSNDKNPNSYNT